MNPAPATRDGSQRLALLDKIMPPSVSTACEVEVRAYSPTELPAQLSRWQDYMRRAGSVSPSRDPAWLIVLHRGLHHIPYCFEALAQGQVCGLLPLAYVRSRLFGRFLVSLPYLNTGGVMADDDGVSGLLVDRAVRLADELDVRYLELRHERVLQHPALAHQQTGKVHMRLALPARADELWKQFSPKVRNQIRKAEKQELTVHWGGPELLRDFYDVFSRNMRDLGTPVYGRRLFGCVLEQFPDSSELCVVRNDGRPIAAALLVHGPGQTEVPSASSLRQFNATNANMLLYWHLLQRAIDRRQRVFDFGRSSRDSNTFRFKGQWGAEPAPAVWQYYLRRGSTSDVRPENSRYARLIRLWRRLPVALTRLIGPLIVRGIP